MNYTKGTWGKIRKNGLKDKRYRVNKTLAVKEQTFWQLHGSMICAIILGAIAGLILGQTLWISTHKKLLDPKGQGIIKVQVVEAAAPFCDDPISYIRCSGEKLGKSNQTIITMIKIAKKESTMNPKAKNRTSSASGLFQIIAGTWYSNDCVGDKWNFKDNTDCAWKVQTQRGFQPWEVWNKGLIK